MTKIRVEALKKGIKRELNLRLHVYPQRVNAGKMKPEDAAHQIQLMKDALDFVERAADIITPLGKFADSLFNGRRGVPKDGTYMGLDTGEPSEAAITIEQLKAAQLFRQEFGENMPKPPEQTSFL